ncbi:MAG: HD domain-containing protein [Armatimonadota bacterium]|nr:HD domain-containing protein [Armatimonadota bacterium]
MEKILITLDHVRKNDKVKTYIEKANDQMNALGYTEHGFRHAGIVAATAKNIPDSLGLDSRLAELSAIAGYLHDIGNVVNRKDHGEISAMLAYDILKEMGMEAAEIATIMGAIGNHEEELGSPISSIGAALILADKADVHRSRVQNPNPLSFDIHDRVNHAVEHSLLRVDTQRKSINLELTTDTHSASVMEYFEIFLLRMLMCRRAADFFGCKFKLIINGVDL